MQVVWCGWGVVIVSSLDHMRLVSNPSNSTPFLIVDRTVVPQLYTLVPALDASSSIVRRKWIRWKLEVRRYAFQWGAPVSTDLIVPPLFIVLVKSLITSINIYAKAIPGVLHSAGI